MGVKVADSKKNLEGGHRFSYLLAEVVGRTRAKAWENIKNYRGRGAPLRLCVCLSMKVNMLHETPELVILVPEVGSTIICGGEFNL
jgi:hypothetical protein